MLGVVAADPLGVLIAFGAGIVSFLSPCVLPLVPGYLSMVSGLSAAELSAARRSGALQARAPQGTRRATPVGVHAASPALVPAGAGSGSAGAGGGATTVAGAGHDRLARPVGRRALGPLLRGILLFIAGFTVVFVALGAAASGLHPVLEHNKNLLGTVAGGLIVFLGTLLLVSALPAGVWTLLGARVSSTMAWVVGERRLHLRAQSLGAWAAPVMGMAFAFAWTPCIGPVLGAILAMASLRSSLGGGMLLLFAYSVGLGVPFLVTGVAFDRLTAFYGRARRGLAWVQAVAALVLIAFGAILVAGDLLWVSSQFTTLLDHLGLQRLTTS